MADGKTNPKVDKVLSKTGKWRDEFERLRSIILGCGLTEELKWGQPCYTLADGANIVLMHGFKDYCAVLFFKGALMKDPAGVLVQQTENVQSARQIRFSDVRQVVEAEAILKAYVQQAIDIEKAGLRVALKPTADFAMPEEFKSRLDHDVALRDAFYALTPGRQRGYLLHFASAKQSRTREARVEKCIPQILDGLGLDD
jgi:uncharacterized protein YdeI (YjbR/CyaY-like superfamily)